MRRQANWTEDYDADVVLWAVGLELGALLIRKKGSADSTHETGRIVVLQWHITSQKGNERARLEVRIPVRSAEHQHQRRKTNGGDDAGVMNIIHTRHFELSVLVPTNRAIPLSSTYRPTTHPPRLTMITVYLCSNICNASRQSCPGPVPRYYYICLSTTAAAASFSIYIYFFSLPQHLMRVWTQTGS